MRIWHQTLLHDPAPCVKAIRSGFITHVLLQARHFKDVWTTSEQRSFGAISTICGYLNIKVIWGRWLWPGDSLGRNQTPEDSIFSGDYYEDFIHDLKGESSGYGFDATCINTEPYSWLPAKNMNAREMTTDEYGRVVSAVTVATRKTGRADYLLPAPLPYPRHRTTVLNLLEAQNGLGTRWISQHTYDKNPSRIDGEFNALRPGDVFGVSATPERPADDLHHWGVDEIPDGDVYIYPGNDANAAAVADKLVEAR